ncbi:MAG: excinuclease ABC subunit UvrA [Bacteroidales bacterium]|nr:excinuclease ABC subunit UvrA [Bacteroidales bacterium]
MDIEIQGARVNNLKNINVAIPQGKLTVITGLSGSGKSSLAFDTLFAEGQRRYVESLSSYARQFLGRMVKPEVDYIHGLAPAVAISQHTASANPRSTVGTQTEVYEYLKLLFARIGRTYSPVSGTEVKRHTVSDVVDHLLSLPDGTRAMITAPLADSDERPLRSQLDILHGEGYQRAVVKGTVVRIDDLLASGQALEEVQLLVDRVEISHDDQQAARLAESVQAAFFEGRGTCRIGDREFSNRFEADGITFEKPNPNFFSFNNPYGACPTCQGYGNVVGIDERLVVPNRSRSIYDNAVVCWNGERMQEWKRDFIRYAARIDFPIHKPYVELTQREKDILWHGDGAWEGIDGFFRWVEGQAYKIQYRVMLARYRGRTLCPDCHGNRLRKDADYVRVGGKNISELTQMPVGELAQWFATLDGQLTVSERQTSQRLLEEIRSRLGYLVDVGLPYLTLARESRSLSGGESQRIQLATSLGSALVGSMYILDEPSVGLHPRDTERLIAVLRRLRDLGNTVIVVEHDEEIIRAADWLIDIGPGAGSLGGEVVYAGPPAAKGVRKGKSLTLDYLEGRLRIEVPPSRRRWRDRISVRGAYANNLKQVDADFPLGVMTVVTGVSGSGKSSLVRGVLYDVLRHRMDGTPDYVGNCMALEGDLRRISAVELVDQNPIGRSSRSNPATYMKVFDEVRSLYARQPLAKSRGYKSGFFSFNVEGGRCETCQGEGYVTVSMQFMSDVHLLCDECHGSRYKDEALEVLYRGMNISQVLDMTVDQAVEFFDSDETRSIHARLLPLQQVGLGYLSLGQSSSSLSGGEAQRIKLASFLVKGEAEQPVLFIFDEPSTGLHFHDIQKLLASFDRLIERGHSVLVIEHHPDIIACADWVLDLGPEGGEAGGNILFAGTPEKLLRCKESYTAKYLKLK